MKIRAILTDLDGTLLAPDASVHRDAQRVLERLAGMGIPVCAVTSKTPSELRLVAHDVPLASPAGFENGAGICHLNGSVTTGDSAVPLAILRRVLSSLRSRTYIPIRSFWDLTDTQIAATTGLPLDSVSAARERIATMPLLVDPAGDEALRAALPAHTPVRLVRGNRFLHLQGHHDKADVVPALLDAIGPGTGVVVACGDAPNDVGLLDAVDIPVIVPSVGGPHPVLVERFPSARLAPFPNGRGWAAAIVALMEATS